MDRSPLPQLLRGSSWGWGQLSLQEETRRGRDGKMTLPRPKDSWVCRVTSHFCPSPLPCSRKKQALAVCNHCRIDSSFLFCQQGSAFPYPSQPSDNPVYDLQWCHPVQWQIDFNCYLPELHFKMNFKGWWMQKPFPSPQTGLSECQGHRTYASLSG